MYKKAHLSTMLQPGTNMIVKDAEASLPRLAWQIKKGSATRQILSYISIPYIMDYYGHVI